MTTRILKPAVAIGISLVLGMQSSFAKSDGSFPGKGSYKAWVAANQSLKSGNDSAARGDLDHALESYKQAIHTYAYDSIYYFNLGNAFSLKGQFQIAEESYREAIKYEPDYFQAWLNLGHTIARQGRPLEAAKALERAAKLSQNQDEKAAIEKTIAQLQQLPSRESPATPNQEAKKKKEKKKKKKKRHEVQNTSNEAGPVIDPGSFPNSVPPN